MASPQADNGHTDIANEILDVLCKTRINGQNRQVLDFILRKTYGWHKKKDRISLSQFEKGTGLKRSRICECIKNLTSMKIIIKIQDDKGTEYEFQKNYEDWEVVPPVGRPKEIYKVVPPVGIKVVPPVGHTKETIQKKLTKGDNFSEKITPARDISSLKRIEGIQTGETYKPDYWSPKDVVVMKRRLEKHLGIKKSTKWQEFIFGTAEDFLKAFEKYEGYKYPDNVLLDQVSKTLAHWFENGETRDSIREMLITFFEGKKSDTITVTPNSVFSSHTYNSWKQNKL